MPHVLRRAVAVTSVLAGLTAAAACGGAPADDAGPMADIATARVSAENGLDQLPPDDAVDAVLAALREERTFHVSGVTAQGMALDISYVVGAGAIGTIGDTEDDSSPIEMLALDGRIYVAGDEEFLADTVGEDAAKTIGGKWLLLAADTTERFDVLANGEQFARAILADGGTVEMTGVREVDGVPAIGLLFRDSGATLWVAASGDPIPLRLEEKGASGGTGVLTFTEVGAEFEIESPDEDDVVDAENLDDEGDAEDADDD